MSITLSEAERVFKAAEAKALELGLRVTISIVDEGGHPVVIHRMDGAGVYTVEISTAMASTVAMFRRPGADLIQAQERPYFRALSAMRGGKILAAMGSMPIRRGDAVIGGIGVSGGSGEQDLEIAQAGLAALA